MWPMGLLFYYEMLVKIIWSKIFPKKKDTTCSMILARLEIRIQIAGNGEVKKKILNGQYEKLFRIQIWQIILYFYSQQMSDNTPD